MSRSVQVQDLKGPGHCDASMSNDVAVKDRGADVLAQLRVSQAVGPLMVPLQKFPSALEEALYAWAVSCYESAAYEDAAVLLHELELRQCSSIPLLKAKALNLLALGRYRDSAVAFEMVQRELRDDPDILFCRAQLAFLQGQRGEALVFLNQLIECLEDLPSEGAELRLRCQHLIDEINIHECNDHH